MVDRSISSTEGLWELVARIRDDLRAAGSDAEAQRLQDAMTVSAHPGEVWPETLAVLRDFLREQPPGLNHEAAAACATELSRWP